MNNTPETDAACFPMNAKHPYVATGFTRKLERERDEANYFLNELAEVDGQLKLRINELCEVSQKAEQERDEAREAFKIAYNERVNVELERDEARAELAEWTDSAKNVRKEYDDEHHCSCVPILRKLLKDAERERDEWAAMCGRYKQERDEARLDKRGG
jgi:hypothetical protein